MEPTDQDKARDRTRLKAEVSHSSSQTCDQEIYSHKPEVLDLPTKIGRPYIASTHIIEKLLEEKYGLAARQVQPLNGYYDSNYHVIVDTSHTNPYIDTICHRGYFVKVSSQTESERPELLHAQLAVIHHLLQQGLPCQTPIRTVTGQFLTECTTQTTDGLSVTYVVSVRTFLPGTIVGETTLTAELLYDMGHFVAKVARALEGFNHPVFGTFDCLWNISHIPMVARATFAVKDHSMRKLSEEVIQAFKTEVVSQKSGFRTGYIHGDLNEQNILVSKHTAAGETPKICGLLDFQHTANSFLLYDLVINIAYLMMTRYSNVPLLDIPGHILAGYTSILTLTSTERAVLRTCIAGRMVQSLVYGAYMFSLDPTNEYVLETSKCGWIALQIFWGTDKEELWSRWDKIVGSQN